MTGDAITPSEIRFNYKPLFSEVPVSILAYPLSTILGEKLETVLRRGIANTRSRDFYDCFAESIGYPRSCILAGAFALKIVIF